MEDAEPLRVHDTPSTAEPRRRAARRPELSIPSSPPPGPLHRLRFGERGCKEHRGRRLLERGFVDASENAFPVIRRWQLRQALGAHRVEGREQALGEAQAAMDALCRRPSPAAPKPLGLERRKDLGGHEPGPSARPAVAS